MKNTNLESIKIFSDSTFGSVLENKFATEELVQYFDERLKRKYRQKLADEFGIQRQPEGAQAAESNGKFGRYFWFVLGGLLVLVGLSYVLFGNRTKETNQYIAHKSELYVPIDWQVRGGVDEQRQLTMDLADAYEVKDFNAVLAAYKKLDDKTINADLSIKQVAGIAYASIGDYSSATGVFQEVLSTKETSYSNHPTVRYLLGVVYLLQADTENAKRILNQIKAGDYKYDEVQVMLKSM